MARTSFRNGSIVVSASGYEDALQPELKCFGYTGAACCDSGAPQSYGPSPQSSIRMV